MEKANGELKGFDENYRCETPVLLIFFNRADTFAQVFAKVREAKPRVLILAQDGARHEGDLSGIAACREIAESVDWDCEVVRNYSDANLGCGMRPKSAIDFALERYASVIILEDDCIPSRSFFPYCEELLERYKDDERVGYISGLNHFETWDCGDSDYFFTMAGSIGAWATWRRAWGRFYDYTAQNINDEYIRKIYRQQVGDKDAYELRLASLLKANEASKSGGKLSYWDTQWGFAQFTQNMLAIVPRVNLNCNVGAGPTSTHAKNLKTTRYVKFKNMLFIPAYELNFPLKHPKFCAPDMEYHNFVYKRLGRRWYKWILNRLGVRKILRALKR